MILLEILVLIVLAAFAANGYRAGSIETLGRLVGSILGFLAARAWSAWPVAALSLFMPVNWAYLSSFIIIFLVVDNAVGFLFKLADTIFKVVTRLPIIRQMDGIIGSVLGFIEGIVVIGGVTFLLQQAAGTVGGAQSFITLKSVMAIEWVFRVLLSFLL